MTLHNQLSDFSLRQALRFISESISLPASEEPAIDVQHSEVSEDSTPTPTPTPNPNPPTYSRTANKAHNALLKSQREERRRQKQRADVDQAFEDCLASYNTFNTERPLSWRSLSGERINHDVAPQDAVEFIQICINHLIGNSQQKLSYRHFVDKGLGYLWEVPKQQRITWSHNQGYLEAVWPEQSDRTDSATINPTQIQSQSVSQPFNVTGDQTPAIEPETHTPSAFEGADNRSASSGVDRAAHWAAEITPTTQTQQGLEGAHGIQNSLNEITPIGIPIDLENDGIKGARLVDEKLPTNQAQQALEGARQVENKNIIQPESTENEALYKLIEQLEAQITQLNDRNLQLENELAKVATSNKGAEEITQLKRESALLAKELEKMAADNQQLRANGGSGGARAFWEMPVIFAEILQTPAVLASYVEHIEQFHRKAQQIIKETSATLLSAAPNPARFSAQPPETLEKACEIIFELESRAEFFERDRNNYERLYRSSDRATTEFYAKRLAEKEASTKLMEYRTQHFISMQGGRFIYANGSPAPVPEWAKKHTQEYKQRVEALKDNKHLSNSVPEPVSAI